MKLSFALLRRSRFAAFIMIALLVGAVETAKADYSITGESIFTSADWSYDSNRWTKYPPGMYDNYTTDPTTTTDVISPLMKKTKEGQRITVSGYRGGYYASQLKYYISYDNTSWEEVGDKGTDLHNTDYPTIGNFTVEFEAKADYYVKLVVLGIYMTEFKIEEYDVVYTPEMTVYKDSYSTVATNNETINFGLVDEAPTYTYYVKNTDRGTLTVEIETTGTCEVTPATLSLEAGQQQTVTIKPATNATVNLKGLNGDELLSTFTVNFKGEVMDKEGKFFEDFNGTSLAPVQASDLPGWDVDVTNHEGAEGFYGRTQFYTDNGTTVLFYYITGDDDTPAYLITPKLHVNGTDDMMYFRANGLRDGVITVSYSADKTNWTSVNTFQTTSYGVHSFSGIPAGNYYIKYELWDATLDWVYGCVVAPEALVLDENAAPAELTTGTQDVVLNYTAKAGWNTIALPFAVSDLSVFGTGSKAYELKGYQDGALQFSPATTLEAGKPYVLYVETPAEANGNYSFEGADIIANEPAAVEFNGAKFVPTYAPMVAGTMAGKYGVVPATGKVQKGSASASLKGFRAYFTLPDNATNARIVIDGEEVTSINAIDVIGQDNAPVYDLSGRKVSVPSISSVNSVLPKGIYIVNGKKMVVK